MHVRLFSQATTISLLFSVVSVTQGQSIIGNNTLVTTLNVIHAPNYNLDTGKVQTGQPNRIVMQYEGDKSVSVLSNSRSSDSLIYSRSVLVSKKRYRYLVIDSNNTVLDIEPFYRSPMSSSTSNKYAFYGRPETVVEIKNHLPSVKYTYEDVQNDHNYNGVNRRLQVHPMNQIPTLHISTKPSDYNMMLDKVLEDITILANISRITADKFEQFSNIKIELSGQTSRLFKKLSYNINIPTETNQSLDGFRRFKIRSCATDPSYVREKISYDLLNAAQVPVAQSSFVRLFINEIPQGLFLFVDNYKDPFIPKTFGDGKKKYKNGALIQGDMQENPMAKGKLKLGANLEYLGSKPTDYKESPTGGTVYKIREKADGKSEEDALKDLIKFMEFINKSGNRKDKKNEENIVKDWNKQFDVSLFLKQLSFELLLEHNDGYMGAAHNYMLYQDPEQKDRFVWLSSDLDQTLGSTLLARRITENSYNEFQKLDRFSIFDNIDHRPLVKRLLEIDTFKKLLSHILGDLHHSLFTDSSVSDYINELTDLIKLDVEWDKQIDLYRTDNFKNNKTAYDNQLEQKVLQLPVGPDFMDRILNNTIGFNAAINGIVENHPSITSLDQWLSETSRLLSEFVASNT